MTRQIGGCRPYLSLILTVGIGILLPVLPQSPHNDLEDTRSPIALTAF
jgi:hypothetical protein